MPISEAFVVSPTQVSREELAEHTQNRLIEAETAGPAERLQIVDEVVTSHIWLAETLARRFSHRGEDEEDLLQVAWLGGAPAATDARVGFNHLAAVAHSGATDGRRARSPRSR